MNNPWKTIKRNYIYENKYGYKLRDDDVINPAGKPGKYMVLEGTGYATVVALTKDKQLVLTRQWRYPIEEESLEIPAETFEENEDPLTAMQRGLQEECGGRSDQWIYLGWHWLGNGGMKIKGHVYLAFDVEISRSSMEDTETIIVEYIDFPEAVKKVMDNTFKDYRTKLGILLADKYLSVHL